MTELRRRFALAALLVPLFASGASAQDTITVQVVSIGDRTPTNPSLETVGRTDCEMDVDILFDLKGVPSTPIVDIWIGSECSGTDRRDSELTDCRYVTNTPNTGTDLRVMISAMDLLGTGCDGASGEPKVWFLAVNTAESAEKPEGVGSRTLTIDLTPPTAPTSVKGGSGERQIPVSWDLPSGDDLDGFVVYIDSEASASGGAAGSSGGGDCVSTRIKAGMDAADVPDEVGVKKVDSRTATRTNLGPNDIDGDIAAVAVSAVDIAGNRSQLSEVVCVEVLPTEGFWDRYEQNGGDVQGGCPCAALGPVHVREAWPVALALFSLVRRRRRARC